jgi:4,5-dihydroxyphthalate decarboxylase
LPKAGTIDFAPFGFDAVKTALDLMSSYCLEMKLIPKRHSVEELFDETTRQLQA